MITKIAFVSHPTRDMAASKSFFGKVLGLEMTANYQEKWCEFDTPDGKSIALDMYSPAGHGPYLALETDNLDAELKRLRKLGVPVVMGPMDNKVCKMAMIQDPAGNKLMLHQMEASRLKALNSSRAAKVAKPAKAAARTTSIKPKRAAARTAKPSSAKSRTKRR